MDDFASYTMAALRELVGFFTSRDFRTNFLANLGGALGGVLLAFWIERRIARRNATRLYGNVLLSVRSELSYLRPQYVFVRDRLKAGRSAVRQSFIVPTAKAALINPLVHEQSPSSLVMALTTLNAYADDTDEAFGEGIKRIRAAVRPQPEVAAALEILTRALETRVDQLQEIMGIALERIDAELARLKLTVLPDPDVQEVRRRLIEILKPESD
jgi:hypothetical protein